MSKYAQMESLLYVAGDSGITLDQLATLMGIEISAARQLIDRYAELLANDENRGLSLLNVNDLYKLVTKRQYAPLLKRFAEGPLATTLSQAALEVLAIIVYKQPITRVEIDDLRGVQSSGAIQTLMLRQLIDEAGRKEAPGRPILYQTSSYFMDYFGLQSLSDLPSIESFQTELEVTDPPQSIYDKTTDLTPEDHKGETKHGETTEGNG